jgi:hypothetical protein
MIAEEISIYLYVIEPCLAPCDKDVGRSEVPPGVFFVVAAAVIYMSDRTIRPPAKHPSAN